MVSSDIINIKKKQRKQLVITCLNELDASYFGLVCCMETVAVRENINVQTCVWRPDWIESFFFLLGVEIYVITNFVR